MKRKMAEYDELKSEIEKEKLINKKYKAILNMKKISIVTGCAGFIGSHMCDYLFA